MFRINNRIIIRKWHAGDEPYLASQANNEKVCNHLMDYFPSPYTFDDAKMWIEKNSIAEKPTNFAIVYDNDPIGNIGIIPGIDVYSKNAALGYWIGHEFWGLGIATNSVKWMVAFAFANFDIIRLYAIVFSNNPASMKVLEKNGFVQEAIIKNSVYKKGILLNEHIFAIHKQESCV